MKQAQQQQPPPKPPTTDVVKGLVEEDLSKMETESVRSKRGESESETESATSHVSTTPSQPQQPRHRRSTGSSHKSGVNKDLDLEPPQQQVEVPPPVVQT